MAKSTKYYLCIHHDKEGCYLTNVPPCNGDYVIPLTKNQAADIIFLCNARKPHGLAPDTNQNL